MKGIFDIQMMRMNSFFRNNNIGWEIVVRRFGNSTTSSRVDLNMWLGSLAT